MNAWFRALNPHLVPDDVLVYESNVMDVVDLEKAIEDDDSDFSLIFLIKLKSSIKTCIYNIFQ